ncbi:MAG: hypothetical protein ACT4QE_04160 [Anaerolineales bacterium]
MLAISLIVATLMLKLLFIATHTMARSRAADVLEGIFDPHR